MPMKNPVKKSKLDKLVESANTIIALQDQLKRERDFSYNLSASVRDKDAQVAALTEEVYKLRSKISSFASLLANEAIRSCEPAVSTVAPSNNADVQWREYAKGVDPNAASWDEMIATMSQWQTTCQEVNKRDSNVD